MVAIMAALEAPAAFIGELGVVMAVLEREEMRETGGAMGEEGMGEAAMGEAAAEIDTVAIGLGLRNCLR